MDLLAHALWAGLGTAAARRRMPIKRAAAAATIGLAVLPDLVQFLPLLGWIMSGQGDWATLASFALAVPGKEPWLPPLVLTLSHHLHCTMPSAVIAALVTVL